MFPLSIIRRICTQGQVARHSRTFIIKFQVARCTAGGGLHASLSSSKRCTCLMYVRLVSRKARGKTWINTVKKNPALKKLAMIDESSRSRREPRRINSRYKGAREKYRARKNRGRVKGHERASPAAWKCISSFVAPRDDERNAPGPGHALSERANDRKDARGTIAHHSVRVIIIILR